MSKIIIMPKNKQQFTLPCDGVILGIKGFSVNMPAYFELEDIKDIQNKEVFIALNKNMHNEDLTQLEEILLKLEDYPIQGVIFYDLAVVNLKKRLNLSYPLVWHQEHMTNNYNTVNFWYQQGVDYSYISSDITLREMKEIKENTKSKLMVTLFGHLPMFVSRRPLISNYKHTFDLESNQEEYQIEKEEKTYPLIENQEGTVVYTDFVIEGLKEMLELDYDYVVLNSYDIEEETFKKVVSIFKKTNRNNIDEQEEQIHNLLPNIKKGFFYEETVYKVK